MPDDEPLITSDHTYWAFLQMTSDADVFVVARDALYRVAGDDADRVTASAALPERIAAEDFWLS